MQTIDYDSVLTEGIVEQAEGQARTILSELIRRGGSDIHFNPLPDGRVEVLFRIDGVLEKHSEIPLRFYRYIESWLKGRSGIPKQEKRNWDGRLDFICDDEKCSFRVATSWSAVGEATKITLRLLPKDIEKLDLAALGFEEEDLVLMEAVLNAAKGIVLVSGPTGSGKTTTLYAAILRIRNRRHVLTIEDPIEAPIEGVTQLEVKPGVASFSDHLKAALRHDPDVIVVGEIRDEMSARIAVSASLSGHLVFGTVHANTAVASVTRMADLDADLYNLAFSLRMSLAQRLLPRLCPSCTKLEPITPREAEIFVRLGGRKELLPSLVPVADGCEECNFKGVKGRIMVYELLTFDEEDRELIYLTLTNREPLEKKLEAHMKKKYSTTFLLERAMAMVNEKKISLESVINYCF